MSLRFDQGNRGGVSGKNLLIRADASTDIGIGHVMRCLALAQAWLDAGGHATFALASGADELGNRIRTEGVGVSRIDAPPGSQDDVLQTLKLRNETKANWLVLDGYQFVQEYRRQLENSGLRLLLIDDHGDCAPYRSEIVVNVNPQASDAMYAESQSKTRFLVGPKYALLRREFLAVPGAHTKVSERAQKILLTFGGSDSDNVTLRVLQALQEVRDPHLQITVIVGATNPNRASLQAEIARSFHAARLLSDVGNMPQLMSECDLAITAGGATCQELAFLQVPMFLITIAENHEVTVEAYARANAAVTAGWFNRIDRSVLAASLRRVIVAPELREEIRANAKKLVDGRGAQRVVDVMCSFDLNQAEATLQ
jgi:UDP-2,4-diacetamido-2,4,6-trideoxy-beta-L-altropyranose hydrolase